MAAQWLQRDDTIHNECMVEVFGTVGAQLLVILLDAHYTDCLMTTLVLFSRYNNDLELEDAIHTAILTLKV